MRWKCVDMRSAMGVDSFEMYRISNSNVDLVLCPVAQ